jgi:hypothetical protein
VFEARTRDRIDSKTDQSSQKHIACGCGDTAGHDLSGYGDLLRDKSVFLEGRDKFFVLLDGQCTRRDASKTVAGMDFCATGRRVESNFVGGPANYCCTPAT